MKYDEARPVRSLEDGRFALLEAPKACQRPNIIGAVGAMGMN